MAVGVPQQGLSFDVERFMAEVRREEG